MKAKAERIKYSDAVEYRQISLLPETLELASSGPVGGMRAQREIYYDEIVAVFRYKLPDPAAYFLAGLYFVLPALVGMLLMATRDVTAVVIGLLFFLGGVVWGGWRLQRARLGKSMVRVTAPGGGPLEFPCQKEQFFHSLMSRIKVAEKVELRLPKPAPPLPPIPSPGV